MTSYDSSHKSGAHEAHTCHCYQRPRVETSRDLVVYPNMAREVRNPRVTNATYRAAQIADASRFFEHVRR